MGNPMIYKRPIDCASNYHLEVDTAKKYCCQEPPHWHLCERGQRIGQIWTSSCTFEKMPDAPHKVVNEALEKTYKYRSNIEEAYYYNKINGSDD